MDMKGKRVQLVSSGTVYTGTVITGRTVNGWGTMLIREDRGWTVLAAGEVTVIDEQAVTA